MKKPIIIMLLSMVATPAAFAALQPLNETDPNWDRVQQEIERVTNTGSSSPVGNRLDFISRVDAEAVRLLFSDWNFYAIGYSNYLKEGFDAPHGIGHIAYGLGYTLAVPDFSSEPLRLYHTGNYEDYGTLLINNKIVIHDEADAIRVWHAFCEIHNKHWQDLEIKQYSQSEWRLGITGYDQTIAEGDGFKTIVKRTHYMKVDVNVQTHRIIAWKSIEETSNKHLELSDI